MDTNLFSTRELALPGVLLITPVLRPDARGFSVTTYDAAAFSALGITDAFTQDYASYSARGVMRGLHFQRAPHAQNKVVRCVSGSIFDVVVDHDPESPTYGQSATVILDDQRGAMLYVPGRYAHGFCVTSDGALVEYKIAGAYHPEDSSGVRFDDPVFSIAWPTPDPILSERDGTWPYLAHGTV